MALNRIAISAAVFMERKFILHGMRLLFGYANLQKEVLYLKMVNTLINRKAKPLI